MWFKRETYCPAGCKCECIYRGSEPMNRIPTTPHATHNESSNTSPTMKPEKDSTDTTHEHTQNETSPRSEHEAPDHSHHDHSSHSHSHPHPNEGTPSHDLRASGDRVLPPSYHESFASDPSVQSPDLLDAPPPSLSPISSFSSPPYYPEHHQLSRPYSPPTPILPLLPNASEFF